MPHVSKLPRKEDLKEYEKKAKSKNGDRIINTVTFFGDSAIPEGDIIYQSVYNAAKLLSQNGYSIVDGGGPGLMKAATEGAEEVDGDTVAVYWEPKLASFFEGKNLANVADQTESQSNYVIRTLGLIEKGDAYVVCKGGTGTVSEFGLVWCLAKLYFGVHKPIILYGDFWPPLIEAFKSQMYIDEKELGVLYYATKPEEIIDLIQYHERKLDKTKLKLVQGDESGFVLKPSAKQIVETYNRFAESYHSQNSHHLVSKEQLDDFISLVNPPAMVLDLGCGPGFDSAYLSDKYAVTAIEISKRFAEIAQFENPNVDVINADMTEYDYGENVYKGIWARDSIHHLEEKQIDPFFKKISKALVEDGIFYIIVREGKGEYVEKEKKNYGELERFYHLFTSDELVNRAMKVGLELVKLEHTQRSHKWLVAVFKKKGK